MLDFDKENNFKVGYEIHSFLCSFDLNQIVEMYLIRKLALEKWVLLYAAL